MAATRLIPLHINKGKTLARSLGDRTDYAKNPEKTEKGELVTAYECDPYTVDEDFLLSKRRYQTVNGRQQEGNIIAYQIRQSFKPGEITPELANILGNELAMRFTKGRFAFIVATHTDKAHIHNHILFNSTSIDGTRKFKNFWLSSFAIQRLSDMICLANGLSVIEPKPYSEREKRTAYPSRTSFRKNLCECIREIMRTPPKSFDEFLQKLSDAGYEIKQGKHIAVRGKDQKRFIRLDSLPARYNEKTLRDIISGGPVIRNPFEEIKRKRGHLLDMQQVILNKGPAYIRWASKFNVNQIAGTLLYARDHRIEDLEGFQKYVGSVDSNRKNLLKSIKAAELRLTEIAALKKHIINYSKTKPIYEAYRKAGYSKQFLAAHREEIEIHKAAKNAFSLLEGKIPTVKELSSEYAELLSQKKETYLEYRKLSSEYEQARVFMQNYSAMVNLKEANDQPQPTPEDSKSVR